MIQEDFVNFECAKLLEEKGFDECCYACYEYFESGVTLYRGWPFEYKGKPVSKSLDRIKCPTLQMAMKWLREVHKCYIHIVPFYQDLNYSEPPKWLVSVDSKGMPYPTINNHFETYEEAVEAAIMYCLNNLI